MYMCPSVTKRTIGTVCSELFTVSVEKLQKDIKLVNTVNLLFLLKITPLTLKMFAVYSK